ncbi:MAG: NapC/NirT family cytochrome c [Chromatiales bacterium]|nr:NapC/NirT family cytochrome c [Chromatiales bacterium]
MKTLKWSLIGLGAVMALVVVMAGSWSLTERVIQATSDETFCGLCHSMRPFAETHALDVHGGHNRGGVSAACADCHLPHDSPWVYLVAKAETGIKDLLAEPVAFFREPNWIGRLERREDYVYDSGCLKCHKHLERAIDQTPAALFGHQTYFAGLEAGTRMQCVTCHIHVGHRDLLARLAPSGAAEAGAADIRESTAPAGAEEAKP